MTAAVQASIGIIAMIGVMIGAMIGATIAEMSIIVILIIIDATTRIVIDLRTTLTEVAVGAAVNSVKDLGRHQTKVDPPTKEIIRTKIATTRVDPRRGSVNSRVPLLRRRRVHERARERSH